MSEAGDTDLFVTPELAIPGYPALDLYLDKQFVKRCEGALKDLTEFSKDYPDIMMIVGNISRVIGTDKVANEACSINNGVCEVVKVKDLLPEYDVFFEERYFISGEDIECKDEQSVIYWKDHIIGVLICEDQWDSNYGQTPYSVCMDEEADIIVSLNASPYSLGKPEERLDVVRKLIAREERKPTFFAYANAVGTQDGYDGELVFDGGSFILYGNSIFEKGRGDLFIEELLTVDTTHTDMFSKDYLNRADRALYTKTNGMSEVYDALVFGVKEYFRRVHCNTAVIGLSGGIDSAVVACIVKDALGADNVIGVTMPTQYNSDWSLHAAWELGENLGIRVETLPLKTLFDQFIDTMKGESVMYDLAYKEKPMTVAEENIQARIRGSILMTFSNRFNALVVSTGNKTELALGYCVDGNSIIQTDNGIFKAKEIYEFLTNNRGCGIGGNRIVKAHISKKKNIVKIKSVIGSEMKVSSDHEVKIQDKDTGRIYFKKAKDLFAKTDALLMEIGSDVWGSVSEFEEFNYEKSDHDFKSFNYIPPKHIDFDISKFIGVCIADGCYCGKGIYRIRSSKDEVFDFCSSVIKSKFNLPTSCWKKTEKDENGKFHVEICSVQFVSWLRHIGIKHGAHNKVVPECILKSDIESVKGFVSGAFMDSTSNRKKNTSEISYHSVSESLIDTMHFMLLNIGVLCLKRCLKRVYKGEDVFLYEVHIPAYETNKLLNGFDFIKKSITKRIKDNESNRIKNKNTIDYIYGMKKEIEYLIKILGWKKNRGLKNCISKNNRVGRSTLKSYIDQLTDSQKRSSEIKRITSIIESNIYSIEIKDIENVNSIEENMYDFSMEYEPEYLINCHVVHNCTLHGDMVGGIAAIADLTKTQVYEMADAINFMAEKELIPNNTINKPPSAELAPDQTDEEGLGADYSVLSPLVERIVRGESIEGIKEDFDHDLVNDIAKRISMQEYKRRQSAPGIRISNKAFGAGRRIPWSNSPLLPKSVKEI